MSNKDTINKTEQRILLFSVFILALCGIIYELVLGSLASYLLGNPVKQYSITIGFFLSSMGLGSYFSRYFSRHLLRTFIIIEVVLGLVGGASVYILSYLFSFSPSYYLLHMFFLVVIGTLVGLEIPLITRIMKQYGSLKDILSNVLSLDYLGGLAGSLLFPLLLYPVMGRMVTSSLIGLMNIGIAFAILIKINYQDKKKRDFILPLVGFVVLLVLTINSTGFTNLINKRFYYDDVLYQKRSNFQEILLTRNGSEFKLFLDGSLQFSSSDEYRYHEMLIFPALSLLKESDLEVLVMGGGDGMAVRELLKSPRVRQVTLVELDPEMIHLARSNASIRKINQNSLNDKRVSVVVGDAYTYLINSKRKFHVIIADFPDPHDETISKLYSREFYRIVKRSLYENGAFVTQSTSPFYAREAFWCINNTLSEVFDTVVPYHIYIPSFGDWGFNMAFPGPLSGTEVEVAEGAPVEGLRFYSNIVYNNARHFSADVSKILTEVNTFNRPTVYIYYLKGWKDYID